MARLHLMGQVTITVENVKAFLLIAFSTVTITMIIAHYHSSHIEATTQKQLLLHLQIVCSIHK